MTQSAAQAHGSVAIPEAEHRVEPSSRSRIDEVLAVLHDHKDEWASLDITERIDLLERLRDGFLEVSERWVELAVVAKGVAPGSVGEGEEWMTGPSVVLRNISLLIASLRDIRDRGVPQLPRPAYARADGQVVAPVAPVDGWDKILFKGFSAEVWMEPGVRLESLSDHQASFYRDKSPKGGVALVLGAGNLSSIGPMDALYKLFVEGQVVVVKMNPVNDYLGPLLEEACAALSERGFFHVIYGGVAEGAYLCEHDLVEEIHITGSDKTHDAIVFGVGEAGARRKADNDPKNPKKITSELGNVTPVLVVPGPWSEKELAFQAANVATTVVGNAGFNCTTTRVVVQHAQWDQREALLEALRNALKRVPDRLPYYPGAEARHQGFLAHHPDADQFGTRGKGHVPWTLMHHLDPDDPDEICFSTESWCGQTSEVALDADSVVEYIDRAVDFCNDRIWGTLSVTVLVHPKSLADPGVSDAVERAIANLRYGTVAINHSPNINYAMGTTTWGAFPGHPLDDIRSGRGVVHNTLMFDSPQKSVLRGPFHVSPTPAWFVTNRNAADIGRKMNAFNASPSFGRLLGLLWASIRG